MKLLYTDDALADLELAYKFTAQKWPEVLSGFDHRLAEIERLVLEHSESGHTLTKRPGIRSVPFAHYPYLFYYRDRNEHVEVLRIYNTSQRPWE
jgi:plasmid stabilization system protein ParE